MKGKTDSFEIDIPFGKSPQHKTKVNYKETTDGIPFYELELEGKAIQLRKEDSWKLLWGELDQETLAEIGSAIDKAALDQD